MAMKIKVYQCEHCKKFYKKTKTIVLKHEYDCYFNPKNKACASCLNNKSDYEDTSIDYLNKYYYCSANGVTLTSETLKYNCNDWKTKGSS